MVLETTPFDPADYLDDNEAIAGYFSDALETNDPAFIADALGVVARAKGMMLIAKETGLSRESLYRSLSDKGNPELTTVLRVMSVLGLQLHAKPVPADADNLAPAAKTKGRRRKSTARQVTARTAAPAKKPTTAKKTAPKKAIKRKPPSRRPRAAEIGRRSTTAE